MIEKRVELTKKQIQEIQRLLQKKNNSYTKGEVEKLVTFYKKKKI